VEFNPPLSWCVVDCDGSACGSPNVGAHTHPVQTHDVPYALRSLIPVARATVRNGVVIYAAV
jgi:hypothetical protein